MFHSPCSLLEAFSQVVSKARAVRSAMLLRLVIPITQPQQKTNHSRKMKVRKMFVFNVLQLIQLNDITHIIGVIGLYPVASLSLHTNSYL